MDCIRTLLKDLYSYLIDRTIEPEGHKFMSWSSKSTKLKCAHMLIKFIEGDEILFSYYDKQHLKQGRLGAICQKFLGHGVKLSITALQNTIRQSSTSPIPAIPEFSDAGTNHINISQGHHHNNQNHIGVYKVDSVLGSGASGDVFSASLGSGLETRALKVLHGRTREDEVNNLAQEAENWNRVQRGMKRPELATAKLIRAMVDVSIFDKNNVQIKYKGFYEVLVMPRIQGVSYLDYVMDSADQPERKKLHAELFTQLHREVMPGNNRHSFCIPDFFQSNVIIGENGLTVIDFGSVRENSKRS